MTRVMKVNVIIEDTAWELVSCGCPQTKISATEKEGFYESCFYKVVTSELLVGREFNDQVGCNANGLGEIHGRFEIGQVNVEGSDWRTGHSAKDYF